MKFLTRPASLLACLILGSPLPAFAVSAQFKNATKARIDKTYAVVGFADGRKTMVPLASLSDDDREFLTQLASDNPLAHGKSQVVVAKEVVKAKQTIEVSKTEGALETVQLCPPNVPRDQIGGTCMVYARVHWLDIAGYPVDLGTVYKIINVADPNEPWRSPGYYESLRGLVINTKPKAIEHRLPPETVEVFDWARGELRKGRPILAAFPREIWQALPPGFIAQHPWNGGNVGHQVVVNGFTWNRETRKGTFHIVNSWKELPEFDLTTDAAKDNVLVFEESLSPRGEVQPEHVKEVVKKITLLRVVGKTNLYEVETNLGKRRIAAENEDAVRELVEKAAD